MFGIFKHIPWFKKSPALPRGTVAMEQLMKGNPLWGANPDRIVRAVTGWDAGNIADMARLVDAYEMHDDVAKVGVKKRDASVARCEHTVLIEEGFEDDPRAQLHRDVLTKFWASIRVTSAFNRSQKGGIRLLKKQMMSAQSIGWSCHNIVWDASDPGNLRAEFIHVPMWHFENLTGELRFKPLATDYYGVPMAEGEWLVNSGDAIGPAVALACCAKRLSLQDWMLFSERAATPGLLGKTGAAPGTDAWNKMVEMLQSWGRAWTGLTDRDTDITTVSLNGSGEPPMPRLVERMDRAIAALYRGADLSTISKGEGLGASLQGEESDMLEADDCITLAEALHEQVDRFVIRYMTGDDVPLAYVWIEPVSKPNVDAEIKIDTHLIQNGLKLSKRDMLQRYGRAEADPAEPGDAVELQQPSNGPETGFGTPFGGQNRLANSAQPGQHRCKGGKTPLQNSRRDWDGSLDDSGDPPLKTRLRGLPDKGPEAVLAAVAKDTAPAADAARRFLELLEGGAADEAVRSEAAAIIRDIPGMLPDDPALATVLADAMAEAYADAAVAELANSADECRAKDPAHCPVHGTPREHRDKGYQDRYGNGNPETLAANPEMNIERGKAVITRLMAKKLGFEPHAMFRNDTGWIGIDYGVPGNPRDKQFRGGHGLSHILAKHPGAEKNLAEVLHHGEAYKHPKEQRKVILIKGRQAVVLSKNRDGRLLITDYMDISDKQLADYTSKGRYHAKGEN